MAIHIDTYEHHDSITTLKDCGWRQTGLTTWQSNPTIWLWRTLKLTFLVAHRCFQGYGGDFAAAAAAGHYWHYWLLQLAWGCMLAGRHRVFPGHQAIA